MTKQLVTNLKPVQAKLGKSSRTRAVARPSATVAVLASGLTPQAIKVFELGKNQQMAQAKVD